MDTPVTYMDSWDDIQKALITFSSHEDGHRLAKDAFEIKSAIESIEQQRKISSFTDNLVAQQKRTNLATFALAALTFFLMLSTAFSAFYTYKAHDSAKNQVEAFNKLTTSNQDVIKAIRELPKIWKSVSDPLYSIQELNKGRLEGNGYGRSGR